MGRSPGFGSTPTYFRPIQTRFRFGSGFPALTCTLDVTRRSVLQKVRRHTFNVLRQFVGIRFQVLFHSPPGVLFTFPSRYWFTIGRLGYLALGGGPPGFPQGFSCPAVLGMSSAIFVLSSTGVLPSVPCLSRQFQLGLITT